MKARTFHVTMTVDAILWRQPDQLEGIFHNTADGRPMTGTEVLAMARHYKAMGYEAIPVCDNHHLGHCQGHEKPEDRTNEPETATASAGADSPAAGQPAIPAGSQTDLPPADEPESRTLGEARRAAIAARNPIARLKAQRDHLANLLRQCKPVMVSHARASHLTEGFRPRLNRWDSLADEIQAALRELDGPSADA